MSDLLFELSTWHAFAKLRLHTESTLHALETSTTRLGHVLRHFKSKTCNKFDTRELPSEKAARGRRDAAAAAKNAKQTQTSERSSTQKKSKPQTVRTFSLTTYKLHALGDYVDAIRKFGTSDSFTTQTVSHDATELVRSVLNSIRVSWNIGDSSGSTRVSTKANLHAGSQNSSGASDFYLGCMSLHHSRVLQQEKSATTTKCKLATWKKLDLLCRSRMPSRFCPHPRLRITTFQGMFDSRSIS